MNTERSRVVLLLLLLVVASFSMGQNCNTGLVTTNAASNDSDGDLVPDWADNCVDIPNRSQRNSTHSVTEVCNGSDPQPDKNNDVPTLFGRCANDASLCLMDVDCHRGDACDCDFSGDGQCNVDDFNLFLADHAAGIPAGTGTDMNEDGVVDDLDFAIFQPLFEDGVAGAGPTHAQVVDNQRIGVPTEGACYDRKWSRLLAASSGRNSGTALSCSVSDNSALSFLLTPNKQQALIDDPDNPTNALLAIRGDGSNQCPSAAFSSGDKTNPLACDAHDLCGSRCGRINDDCDRQFYRDLFNTCEALSGSERSDCRADCLDFATFYASAIATGDAVLPVVILSPPPDDSPGPPSIGDLKDDDLNCLCSPPVCERNADCAPQNDQGAGVTCDRGYCVQQIGDQGCSVNADCAPGYRCSDPAPAGDGDCVWDVSALPDRPALGLAPPVCGDGLCEAGLESCAENSCPADCVGAAIWDGSAGSCGLGDACGLNLDCAEGACFQGTCQLLQDGMTCKSGLECQSDGCGAISKECSSVCTLDSECGSGVCHLFQCVPPLADGLICDNDSDCQSGLCAGVCLAAAVQDPGDVCLLDGQCKSDQCVAGFCQGSCGDGFCTVVPNGETCFAEGCQADCGACPTATPGCDEDADCAGGLCGGGVCLDRASLDPGNVCLFDAECRSGTCSAGLCAGSCGDGFCTLLPDAEGCLSCSADCGLCTDGTFGCVVDAQCASNDCRGGFCGGVPNGDTCIANNQCASGTCNNAVCVNPGSVGLGGICTTSSACGSGTCTAGLCVCDSNSDCPSGKSCVAAVCITTPTCTSNGGSCAINSTCCSKRCDGIPPICKPKLGNGSSCNENSDCSSGRCDGTCKSKLSNGSSCNENSDCKSGDCGGIIGFQTCR